MKGEGWSWTCSVWDKLVRYRPQQEVFVSFPFGCSAAAAAVASSVIADVPAVAALGAAANALAAANAFHAVIATAVCVVVHSAAGVFVPLTLFAPLLR